MLSTALTLGTRLTFVGGKGGVGKTTVAAALAVELADLGLRTGLISVDPAHSLGDALGIPLSAELTPLPQLQLLHAAEIGADAERTRFLSENGDFIEALIERGTYLDSADVKQFTGSSLPGIDEIAALLSLLRLSRSFDGRLIVDTAPTGHTLRLLELPQQALSWVAALEAMDSKHAAIASAFAGAYAADEASAFLDRLRHDLGELVTLIHDPEQTRFLIVTTSEPGVLPETYRLQDRLEEIGIAPAGIVLNRSAAAAREPVDGVIPLPLLTWSPTGLEGLRALMRIAGQPEPAAGAEEADDRAPAIQVSSGFQLPADRELYVVVGKGGVGKSTSAGALAVKLAASGRGPILLLSVDPAGSLSEVLDQPVGPQPSEVKGTDGLFVRQLDATRRWTEFRKRYRSDVEGVFAGLLSGSTSATLDRAVLDRLIDLSPPGIDELVAVMEVIDANEDRVYDALVLDTAPTGHLLRLLEMPDVALEWTHSLLRILLRYREVVPLSGIGERVLKLAQSLGRLQEILHDAERSFFLVVTLPDDLSIAETGRLIPRLREMASGPGTILLNRAPDPPDSTTPELLQQLQSMGVTDGVPLVIAPACSEGPQGARELLSFINAWRMAGSAPPATIQ